MKKLKEMGESDIWFRRDNEPLQFIPENRS